MYTLTAPALEPDDYLARTQTLQFSSTVTSFDITIPIIPDDVVEFDEMFLGRLELPTPDPAVILDPDRATVTIIDTSSESELFIMKCSDG